MDGALGGSDISQEIWVTECAIKTRTRIKKNRPVEVNLRACLVGMELVSVVVGNIEELTWGFSLSLEDLEALP